MVDTTDLKFVVYYMRVQVPLSPKFIFYLTFLACRKFQVIFTISENFLERNCYMSLISTKSKVFMLRYLVSLILDLVCHNIKFLFLILLFVQTFTAKNLHSNPSFFTIRVFTADLKINFNS